MPVSGSVPENVPSPDPSAITQRTIDKTKDELRADYQDKIAALHTEMVVRLDAMDKASVVLAENVTRVPTLLDREVARVVEMLKRSEELMGEKFISVSRQFHEREVRTEGDKQSNTTAINAALAALKEMIGLQNNANATAVAKSESATTKELESLNKIIASTKDAIASDIRNLASRLDRGEGGEKANSSNQTTMFAVAALVVSILVGGFSIISGMRKDPQPVPSAVAVVPVNPR